MDLTGESLDSRSHQQFVLFLEPVFDPGAVPDLDRNRDAQHGRQYDQDLHPELRGRVIEQPRVTESMTEHLPDDFETDRRGQQDDDPVDFKSPDEFPDVAVQVGEEQGREVPDRFFRTDLPQPSAGEAAPDRKRNRDPFSAGEGGEPHHRADDGAGVGTGDQPGEECARKREVGRLELEKQSNADAGGKGNADAGGEDQPLGPVAALGEQDPAEPGKSHQHGRQHGRYRDLHDQRGQQEILSRQRFRRLVHRAQV